MKRVWVQGTVCAAALLWAMPSSAQLMLDYSGLAAGQVSGLYSEETGPPFSTIPIPRYDIADVVGRFYGRIDARAYYQFDQGRFGIDAGVYSNLNTAYDHRRGIVPFDRANLNLTRIRPETAIDFDRLQLFNEGPYGRFELGWGTGISERTFVGAPLNWGVGSVGGDYPYFLNKPNDVGFVTLSSLGSANYSPRVAYYTPWLYGFKAGISYQPDTRNTGFDFQYGGTQLGLFGRRSSSERGLLNGAPVIGVAPPAPTNGSFEGYTAGFTNVVEGGIRSDHNYGPFRVQASLGGIYGQAVESPLFTRFSDLVSYQFGAQLSYGGWSIGGGYVGAGDSGYTKDYHLRQRLNQHSAHAGIQYETGPWTFGAAWLLSDDAGDPTERSDRQLHVYSGGVRYRLSQNFDVGGEFNYIRTLSPDYGDRDNYQGILQLRYRFDGNLGGVPLASNVRTGVFK